MTLRKITFYDEDNTVLGEVEFNEALVNDKALSLAVGPELLEKISKAKYAVSILCVYPSLDVLSIRQDAALNINYSLLGETGK